MTITWYKRCLCITELTGIGVELPSSELELELNCLTLECLINVPVRVFISRKMPPYTGLIWH